MEIIDEEHLRHCMQVQSKVNSFLTLNSRKYGLVSFRKTPTEGSPPTGPGHKSTQLALFLQLKPDINLYLSNFSVNHKTCNIMFLQEFLKHSELGFYGCMKLLSLSLSLSHIYITLIIRNNINSIFSLHSISENISTHFFLQFLQCSDINFAFME